MALVRAIACALRRRQRRFPLAVVRPRAAVIAAAQGSMSRLVKRYGNRKLYDTSESRYVTLDEIGRWVKAGEDVKILENDTGEDLTAVTFAQIILEEERKSGLLSLPVLRDIIQRGEAALQGISATVDPSMETIR